MIECSTRVLVVDGNEHEYFGLDALAEALYRSTKTIRRWEGKLIPRPPVTDRDGWRAYRSDEIAAAREVTARTGLLDRKHQLSEREQILLYNRLGTAWKILREFEDSGADEVADTVMSTELPDDQRLALSGRQSFVPRKPSGLPATRLIEMGRRSPPQDEAPWTGDFSQIKWA